MVETRAEDAVALARVRGDHDRFDAFYTASSRPLLGQMYALCGDVTEAQDCLQEAYLRAWQRWATVSTYDDPAAWVRSVAWRLAINRWHRAGNTLRAWRRQGSLLDVAEISPDTVMLTAALRQLPPAQRQAVVLHHLAGLAVEQIAHQLGTPTGTIKARLTRGRALLAKLLSEEAPA